MGSVLVIALIVVLVKFTPRRRTRRRNINGTNSGPVVETFGRRFSDAGMHQQSSARSKIVAAPSGQHHIDNHTSDRPIPSFDDDRDQHILVTELSEFYRNDDDLL